MLAPGRVAVAVDGHRLARLEARPPVGVDGRAQQVGGADEVGDEPRRGPLVELLGRAQLLDVPRVHDRDPVAHRERLLLVVGHVDERDPDLLLDALQLDLQLAAELEVERAQRLVEQQDVRPVRQRPRERDALLLAAGELVRLALLVAVEPHQRERVADAAPDLVLRPCPCAWARTRRCRPRTGGGTGRSAGTPCSPTACRVARGSCPGRAAGSARPWAARSRRSCGASWSCRSPKDRAARRTRRQPRRARRGRRRARRRTASRGCRGGSRA